MDSLKLWMKKNHMVSINADGSVDTSAITYQSMDGAILILRGKAASLVEGKKYIMIEIEDSEAITEIKGRD